MARTDEQKAADDALTEAIQRVIVAYLDPDDDRDYLLTDYIVIHAGARFDDEGDSWSRIGIINRESNLAAYRILGLLDFARARTQKYVAQDED